MVISAVKQPGSSKRVIMSFSLAKADLRQGEDRVCAGFLRDRTRRNCSNYRLRIHQQPLTEMVECLVKMLGSSEDKDFDRVLSERLFRAKLREPPKLK